MAAILGWLFGSTTPAKHRIYLQNPDTYHPYPKDWNPIGYPCIVTGAYDGARIRSSHNTNGLPGLVAREDAEGVILDFTPDRINVKVGLPRTWDRTSRSASAGWVPARLVMIGTKRKHGKFTTLDPPTQLIQLNPRAVIGDLGLPAGSGLWVQTIAAFLEICSSERLALSGASDVFWRNIDAGVPRYALTLEATVGRHDPALCRMLNTGKFALSALIKNRPGPDDEILQTIPEWVYLIVYRWKFDKKMIMSAKEGEKAAINVGNSKSPDKRWDNHVLARKNAQPGSPFHYTLAKSATSGEMFLMVPVADRADRFIFEQIMQNTLESQAPFCKEYEGGTVTVPTDSAQDLQESGKVLSHKLNELVTESMSIAKQKQAKALYELFKKAKAKTGWSGGCEDPSFLPGGRVIGTNHDQPLYDGAASTSRGLSLQRIPGVCSQYKFPSHQVSRSHGNDKELALYLYEQDVKNDRRLFELVLTWPAGKDSPQLGAQVVATIERMEGDLVHPAPYARLPAVGCISSWKAATQLGIRLEWQDENNNPCWMYYQRSRLWDWQVKDTQGRTPIGCMQGFLAAEALCRLTDQQLVSNLPKYYFSIRRPLNILEIKVDHLEQEFGVEQVPRPLPVTWPQDANGQYNLKSQEAVVQELLDAGFPMSSIFDCEFGKIDGKRSKCNRCGLASKKITVPGKGRIRHEYYNSTISNEGCERVPGTNSCKECYTLGVPCTWYNLTEVMKSEKMMKAIGHPPYHDKSVHGLDDVDISRTPI